MINIIKSEDRYQADHGWLQTRWHFSFGDYYDPSNVSFGPLRVFNDDVIQPAKGFDLHPHRDMEIITYVVDGQLEHRDHLGNRGVVHPGEVQVMSAGKGIMHAEYNHSQENPVRLMQLWIQPKTKGGQPHWDQKRFSVDDRKDRWLPVVSGADHPSDALTINQDATIYVSNLTSGHRAVHRTDPHRKVYLFVITGTVTLNNQELSAGDQARIEGESQLDATATTDAELILLDLPD
ncbi:MAG TPA: pirin family protein [Tepidisphaeraceae bacterium]|jgi:hypothetical protein|nr:pirin family protein [Tepidisphaeraceae bacterium]